MVGHVKQRDLRSMFQAKGTTGTNKPSKTRNKTTEKLNEEVKVLSVECPNNSETRTGMLNKFT